MNSSLSSRYAKALFDLEKKQNNLEKRLGCFESIVNTFKENAKLRKFLKAPHIDVKYKKDVLSKVFKDKFDAGFMHFLMFLIQKGRINNLESIAKEYKQMVNDHLGIWNVKITTAIAIDEKNEMKLKEKLSKKFQKQIILSKKVNPNIIGGLIMTKGNVMLDWSVEQRLKKIKENL